MPPPQPNNTVQESWTPEPELRDPPPRRITDSDYPDLNQINGMVFYIIGGVLIALGLVLLVLGLSGKGMVFVLGGIILALGGTAVLVIFPQKQKNQMARAEHLVMHGIPVAARVLSSDNLTGTSTYGRSVKYQVTLPGGEMAHRSVNADERALPKRVPGDTTALVDPNTGDVELYCALPFRAVSRNPIPAAADPLAPNIPTTPPIMASTSDPIVAPTMSGPFGDRLVPSSAATNGSEPAAPIAVPVHDSMGTIIAPPRAEGDEGYKPPVPETPPTPKEPEAAPQTWE